MSQQDGIIGQTFFGMTLGVIAAAVAILVSAVQAFITETTPVWLLAIMGVLLTATFAGGYFKHTMGRVSKALLGLLGFTLMLAFANFSQTELNPNHVAGTAIGSMDPNQIVRDLGQMFEAMKQGYPYIAASMLAITAILAWVSDAPKER